ncbi:MAG: Wzt carbohydrate-binding domain-containing protein [Methanoregula sp.]|nr:Wzt carbohydrate-binding domain-containing protein [Methanoregula sp.]
MAVQIQTVEIQSAPRRMIFAHPPSKISYRVAVEPEASLSFAIGILPEAWERILQGVKFDIDVLFEGKTENIFSRVLQPKRNIGDRGWHNFIVPMENFFKKTVSLTFSTSGSGEDLSYCWSAWGWVKMIKDLHSPDSLTQSKTGEIVINKDIENLMPELSNSKVRIGNSKAKITKVELRDIDGKEKMTFQSGECAIIQIHILFLQDIEKDLTIGCIIKGKYSEIFGTNTRWEGINLGSKKKGEELTVQFSQRVNLATGIYSVTTGCAIVHSEEDVEVLDRCYDCIFFRVQANKKMVGIVNLETKVDISHQ